MLFWPNINGDFDPIQNGNFGPQTVTFADKNGNFDKNGNCIPKTVTFNRNGIFDSGIKLTFLVNKVTVSS